MKFLLFMAIVLFISGCSAHRPATHQVVSASYEQVKRSAIVEELVRILVTEEIPVKKQRIQEGVIETDSFDVQSEFCDCGKNLLGAEYPGRRRGVMRITVSGNKEVTVKFDFKTRLTIRANNKVVICNSLGIMERNILKKLDNRLGLTGIINND